jgi:beta-1,2-mannobiose phosphorylase / 1,2-beta-oligomannan phosphorylase
MALAVLPVALLGSVAAFPRDAGAREVTSSTPEFPRELVDWRAHAGNPVFTGEGPGHWDAKIRERGWILREGRTYHMWYTGYDGTRSGVKRLGYAWSCDGIHWTRSAKNPLVRDHWVEDMMVVKHCGTYYMFAEGERGGDIVMLTSCDRLNWKYHGVLDIRRADGATPMQKPRGTPTVWIEHGTWYLFYEHGDLGVWIATTRDPCSKRWTNVQDDPVLGCGPAACDEEQIALNQIIKHNGVYYAFYHGSGRGEPRVWNTNIARSTDLVHWQKFAGNPIIEDNKSSGIVVHDGCGFRLYTMHDRVDVFEQGAGSREQGVQGSLTPIFFRKERQNYLGSGWPLVSGPSQMMKMPTR